MGTDVEILKELFEIAAQDYILAEEILRSGKITIDFETIKKYSGSRNASVGKFLKTAVEFVDENSLNIKELLKYSKGDVSLRKNVCIYLILSYKESDIDIEMLLTFLDNTSWPESVELIENIADKYIVTEDNFLKLISLYDKKRGGLEKLLGKILLRAPKEALNFNYLNDNKLIFMKSSSSICRQLLLTHFKKEISNEILLKMYSRDSYEFDNFYVGIISERIHLGEIKREFWQECIDKGKQINIAEYFIKMYSLSPLQKAEKELFLSKL